MPLTTFVIVLAAAFIHALWNLIVVQARDRTATTTVVIIFGALLVIVGIVCVIIELALGAFTGFDLALVGGSLTVGGAIGLFTGLAKIVPEFARSVRNRASRPP